MTECVLVSACLLGERCRYDGAHKLDRAVARHFSAIGARVVPICPEQLGGLTTPRPACAIDPTESDGNDVLDGAAAVTQVANGVNETEAFLRGAALTLDTAEREGATRALLKEGSPSCGVHRVLGVAAAALARHGLALMTEEDLPCTD